ncbi:MAG: peptidylprolyl isomerase [Dehalococcoidia bacterium]
MQLPLTGRLTLLIALAFMLVACGGGGKQRVVADGDTVSVMYTGTLDDGTVFDSSEGGDPLTFVVGQGQMIAGFEAAVYGMAVGDKKDIHIEPADAYGERRDDRVVTLPRDGAPAGLKVGDRVQLGNGAPATVIEITADSVTVDANHELAGQALNFAIEVVSVE